MLLWPKGEEPVCLVVISPRSFLQPIADSQDNEDFIITVRLNLSIFRIDKRRGCVLFSRFPTKARTSIAKTVVDIVQKRSERLKGKFTVVQPGRVRFVRLP